MRPLFRVTLAVGLAAFLVSSIGCSSLRYKKTEDLWTESDQKFNSGQYGDAVPYYDELLRRDENDARARDIGRGQSDSFTLAHVRASHYNAAEAYFRLGEFGSAMEHMEAYKQIAEQTGMGVDGRDYYWLCITHYMSGDMDGARAYLPK